MDVERLFRDYVQLVPTRWSNSFSASSMMLVEQDVIRLLVKSMRRQQ